MPIIVQRIVTLDAFYAQGRRIKCAHCGKPFTYLDVGIARGGAQGTVPFSGADDLGWVAVNRLKMRLRKISKKERLGAALCPHCKDYQSWMVSQSRARKTGLGILIGGLIGVGIAVLLLVLQLNGLLHMKGALHIFMGGPIAGMVVGALIGLTRALKPGPYPGVEDHRAMKDEELAELITKCKKLGDNPRPMLAWALLLGIRPPEKMAAGCLGIMDQTGSPPFSEFSSERMVREFTRALDRI